MEDRPDTPGSNGCASDGGAMEISVDMIGEEPRIIHVDGDTYGDILRAVGLSPQEAAVFIEDRPVPADQKIEHEEVRVLRLIAGG